MPPGTSPGWRAGTTPTAHAVLDLRPLVLMPGMVDLHAHLPQIPNAGLGSGLDLLTWLDRYIFPLERAYDRSVAERQAPKAFRSFAAAGTTTVVAYAALWPESTDAAFVAAEAHGIRAVIGKVMMDRLSYDTEHRVERDPGDVACVSPTSSPARWHGADARPPALRVHAALRRQLFSGDAARLRGPRHEARRLLADPPVGGRR